MPTRQSKKKKKDFSQIALDVVEAATGEKLEPTEEETEEVKETPIKKKNPAAVALGKLGASKGGKARAKKLTAEQRKEIARKAAKARWKKKTE